MARLQTRATARPEAQHQSLPGVMVESRAVERANLADTRIAFRPWAMKIPEPKTGALDFDLFPFQEEWYSDEWTYARDGAIVKPTQIGGSAWGLRWALFWPDTRGKTALYVFPKERHLRDFSAQRVKPLILASAYLRGKMSRESVDNMMLKQLGQGFINFRGSQNKDGLDSVDADVLFLDEYDTLVQGNIPDAEKRVSGPLSQGLTRRIGVPSLPGFGIDRFYRRTDMRVWMVRCPRCPERWQEIDFWRNVIEPPEGKPYIACARCQEPLDVRKGQWVAQEPTREVRGYKLSKLIVFGADLAKVAENSRAMKRYEVQTFWNKDLGEPYSEADDMLDDAALHAAQSAGGGYFQKAIAGYSGRNPVTAGIDVASVRDLNVRISEQLDEYTKRALFIGPARDFHEVATLLRRFRVNMACIDHLPDGRKARELANTFRGIVYVTAEGQLSGDPFVVNDEQMTCTVDRTKAFDGMLALVRAQKNWLPLDVPDDYFDHMKAPTRYMEEDEKVSGKVKVGYRSTGPDHYAHAELFDLVATELYWRRVGLDRALAPQEHQLDELVPEFERSHLDNPDSMAWTPGPDTENSYGPTFDDDDDIGSSWSG